MSIVSRAIPAIYGGASCSYSASGKLRTVAVTLARGHGTQASYRRGGIVRSRSLFVLSNLIK